MKVLKFLFIPCIALVVIIFAVWSGLSFHDYESNIVYSEKNFIRAMQYVSVGLWGLSMALSPVWVIAVIALSIKLLFPDIKLEG